MAELLLTRGRGLKHMIGAEKFGHMLQEHHFRLIAKGSIQEHWPASPIERPADGFAHIDVFTVLGRPAVRTLATSNGRSQ